MDPTIAALATAYGRGAISIVRVSGERALELGLKLTQRQNFTPRYAYFCKLYTRNFDFIDEAIVIYFKAPFSFTGEDVVEFQTHGGTTVSEILLEELAALGACFAKAGEFSKRACLNGKMTPLKALNIQDLIQAKSNHAAKLIARNMQGRTGELVEKIRAELVKTLAFVETSIDYADDDLPQDLLRQIATLCEENAKILSEIHSLAQSKKGLLEGFKILILGKPNVGKSSLLNALLSYERAIVSDLAGTTRDTVEENFKLGTHLLTIIDTAGIREGEDEVEKRGIERSKKKLLEADIILALFDASRLEDDEDRQIYALLENSPSKIFYLLNKSDLQELFVPTRSFPFIKISTKEDLAPLKNELESYLNGLDGEGFLTCSMDFIEACRSASGAIMRAKKLLDGGVLELFAFELNVALDHLAKFTKDFQRSEILDEMFSNFCLGK